MKIVVLDKTNDTADILKVNYLGMDIVKEMELAHQDYTRRKNEVISKLFTIWKNDEIPTVYRNWIRQAARFINESDMR